MASMVTDRATSVLVSLFCVVLIVITAACASVESAIIGKWKLISARERDFATIMEFFKDGTVVESGILGCRGTYKFIEAKRMRVDCAGFRGLFGPVIYEVSFSGDRLILKYDSGIGEYLREK